MVTLDFGFAKSKEEIFDLLDEYAVQQRAFVKKKKLQQNTGIIKSYMIETEHGNAASDTRSWFKDSQLQLLPIEADFYRASVGGELYGFVEEVNSRYLLFHTIQLASKSDKVVKKTVNTSSKLDFVWLSGHYLNLIWDAVIKDQYAHRYVKMQFEYDDIFRREIGINEQEDNGQAFTFDTDEEEIYDETHKQSSLSIGMTARKIASVLSGLQDTLEDFKVMTRLRMPSPDSAVGGYDFWNWGKVTYRSSSFREGRIQIYGIVELYEKATEVIEQLAWFQAETTQIQNAGESFTFTGAPISFIFPQPLDNKTFNNFIRGVFDQGNSNFRLWGNPIYIGANKVHVYGIDMHLWQKIYMELTPARFILVLPKNTCGNTVHRLVSNIQRYLSPDVKVYIGDIEYTKIILGSLLGRGNIQ